MRTCEAPSEPKMVVAHSLLVAYSLKCMWLHSSDINLIMQLPLTIPIIPTRSQWGRYAHISSSYFLCSAISDVSTLSYSWIVKSKTVVTSLVISYIISSCIYIYAMPFHLHMSYISAAPTMSHHVSFILATSHSSPCSTDQVADLHGEVYAHLFVGPVRVGVVFSKWSKCVYPLVNIQKTMENHHF